MYELVRGPLVWVSLIVFVTGTVFQIVRFYTLSRKAGLSPHVPLVRIEKGKEKKKRFSPGRIVGVFKIVGVLKKAGQTVIAVHPVTITVSTLFHICLVLVPLFLLGHNELLELTFGAALPSVPERTSDILTVIVLICCAFFLFRRIFLSRVRAITSFYDYLVLALATVPFLSGFLAFHQISDYRTMMIVHMLSGELMIMAIPFTKLTHMIFFFLNRFLVINEHTLGRGSRAW
jgi:nitrate reductase gamma subunit